MALAVKAKIGKDRNSRLFADLPHRFVAVHLGHHDVHEDDAELRRILMISMACRPLVALITSMS